MGDTLMSVPLLRNCDANLSAEDQMIVIVKSRLEVEVLNSLPWSTNVEIWTAERGGGKNYLNLVQAAFKLRAKKKKGARQSAFFFTRMKSSRIFATLIPSTKS